jgi:hypothetical protein
MGIPEQEAEKYSPRTKREGRRDNDKKRDEQIDRVEKSKREVKKIVGERRKDKEEWRWIGLCIEILLHEFGS